MGLKNPTFNEESVATPRIGQCLRSIHERIEAHLSARSYRELWWTELFQQKNIVVVIKRTVPCTCAIGQPIQLSQWLENKLKRVSPTNFVFWAEHSHSACEFLPTVMWVFVYILRQFVTITSTPGQVMRLVDNFVLLYNSFDSPSNP